MTHFTKTRCTLAYCSKFTPSIFYHNLTADFFKGGPSRSHYDDSCPLPEQLHSDSVSLNIRQASLMKFGGPASLTLWIMNWQKLFIFFCCLVKSHSVQSHLHLLPHTLTNSHFDMRLGSYWPANSSQYLWFMSAPMPEHIKLWSVHACVWTDCVSISVWHVYITNLYLSFLTVTVR